MRIVIFWLIILTALVLPLSLNSLDVYDINKDGPRTQKFKISKSLRQLSYPNGPVEVVMARKSNATLLYGRMHPSCDPDLLTYKECEQNETLSNFFICPQEPTAFLLVQTNDEVKEIRASYTPIKVQLDEYLLDDIENDLERRNAILSEITSGGISNLHNYGHTGFFRIYGSHVIPLSTSPGNRFEIIAAVSDVGMGRVLWFARPNYALDLEKEQSPMSTLRDNIRSVCGSAATRFKRLKTSSFTNAEPLISSEVIFFWSPFHDRLGAERIESLRNFVYAGGCLIIGIDTWNYNVYVSPYLTSELRPLLVDGGIWPGNYNSTVFRSRTPFDLGGQDAVAAQHSDPKSYITQALAAGLPDDCAEYFDGLMKVPFGEEFRNSITEVYNQLLHRYNRYHVEWLSPCSRAPVTDYKRRRQLVCLSALLATPFFSSVTQIHVAAAPMVFPGPVPLTAPRNAYKLRFTSARAKHEALPTGLYLAPGETVDILVLSGDPQGWAVATMWQSIDLNINKKSYIRWPSVRRVKTLNKEFTSFFSSFGGVLWLLSPKNTHTTLEIQVSNVVETPAFDRNIKWPQRNDTWTSLRAKAKAPWGHLGGSFAVIVVPAGALRHIDQPQLTTDKYDRCVRAQRWLAAVNGIKRHREVIALDAQINVGYMHAGYPIMGPLSLVEPEANFLKLETRNKTWGPFHELGHNLYKPAWTMSGYSEVTSYIFTVFCDQLINDRSPWSLAKNSWLQGKMDDVKQYVQGDKSKDGFMTRLAVYMHLQSAFGWLGLRRTFQIYEKTPGKTPTTDQEKFDTWYLRTSNVTGMDLAPLYLLWFWNISTTSQASLAHLPAFLPNDFATNWAPHRVQQLQIKFGPRLTRVPTVLKPTGIEEDIQQQSAPITVKSLLEITPM